MKILNAFFTILLLLFALNCTAQYATNVKAKTDKEKVTLIAKLKKTTEAEVVQNSVVLSNPIQHGNQRTFKGKLLRHKASVQGKKAELVVLEFDNDENIQDKIMDLYASGLYEFIEEDQQGEILGEVIPNDPGYSNQWSLSNDGSINNSVAGIDINMPEAWSVTKGSGTITVATLDTGLKLDHPEFDGRLWVNEDEIPYNGIDDDNNGFIDDIYGYNMINVGHQGDAGDADPTDDHRHGTHVTSIIGANGNNSNMMAGVDWNCKLMTLKVLNSSGSGWYSDWIQAIYYAVDNGADVINMSLGGTGYSAAMQDAVDYAVENNVIIVASMGNSNNSTTSYPAGLNNVVSVGALSYDGTRASPFLWGGGSSYGNHIDISAPGNGIVGLSHTSNTSYVTMSGTSQAAPIIAGIIALMKGLGDPDFSLSKALYYLEKNAVDEIGRSNEDREGHDAFHGAGMADAYATLLDYYNDINSASSCETATTLDNTGSFTINHIESNGDAWYQYTATQDGLLRVSTCGLNNQLAVETAFEVYKNSCDALVNTTEQNCSSTKSEVFIEAETNDTFYIKFINVENNYDEYTALVDELDFTEGYSCDQPIVGIEGENAVDFSASEAQWYSYTFTKYGEVTVSSCDNNVDTDLNLYTSCEATPENYDDTCGSASTFTHSGEPGDVIFFQWANTYGGGNHNFDISFEEIITCDQFEITALTSAGIYTADNTQDTDYFSYTAERSGELFISTAGHAEGIDTYIVLDNDCDPNDGAINSSDNDMGLQSIITTTVTEGETYYLRFLNDNNTESYNFEIGFTDDAGLSCESLAELTLDTQELIVSNNAKFYEFTIPSDGELTIISDTDTYIDVYSENNCDTNEYGDLGFYDPESSSSDQVELNIDGLTEGQKVYVVITADTDYKFNIEATFDSDYSYISVSLPFATTLTIDGSINEVLEQNTSFELQVLKGSSITITPSQDDMPEGHQFTFEQKTYNNLQYDYTLAFRTEEIFYQVVLYDEMTFNKSTYYTVSNPLEINETTIEGYTFDGWYTDADFTTSFDIDNHQLGDLSLYAKWSLTEYLITYHNGYDHDNPNSFTFQEEIYFEDAERDDYTFMGWYSDEQLLTPIESIATGTTENINVYAKWEEATSDDNDIISSIAPTEQIAFYPNPSNQFISFTNSIDHLVIYNMSGQQVCEFSRGNTFDISQLQVGLYMVYVYVDDQPSIVKLIKQ
ncbi:S8 family serine peptidase [Flammeovirga agarivorans]|uniref:S8 family serine peptidase n=1 Tax=Flammeovirga agarivorans TaxID=2726742 RepID=A0A7X8SQ72_9BACT|nr:S8 family serine peptidase [Flammeovirga agarivorans]NLR94315.1 S8 family serine peptidase [Flammeovirga agarivorans]